MNIFKRLLPNTKRKPDNKQKTKGVLTGISDIDFQNNLTNDDFLSNIYIDTNISDCYLSNAWINIAVNILIRNLARAEFVLEREGEEVNYHRQRRWLECWPLKGAFL